MRDLQADIALSNSLNQQRLSHAQKLLGEHARLFRQLPWLLHHNRPGQPGYTPGAPYGFVRPPSMPGDGSGDTRGPLLGLYTMGSTGSFGQATDSDIDCWLIHPLDLDEEALTRLRLKCDRLSAHFASHGLELHLYLIRPDLLRHGQQQGLSSEHSGSTQNWLLLEEFYRSQIHLAGLPLAWWPNAPTDHPELLNLGQLRHLPATEIFGAALWQLFKGLSRPHKAALKVLLLEAYVADYPDLRILRDQLWLRLKAGKQGADTDHYLMLFERISFYLQQQGDRRRLTMAQRCFYLKCGLPLSQPESRNDWRCTTLQRLTQEWRYTRELLLNLDGARQWHAGQLRWCNERLDQLMLTSYQRLTGFASRLNQRHRVRLDEMAILTRKLYTRFDAEPAKIPRLNRLWSKQLGEPNLTLVSVQDSPNFSRGWYLYRTAPKSQQLFGESPLFHADNRLACLAWALSNGLVQDDTEFHCHQNGQSWHSRRLTLMAQRLRDAYRPAEEPSFDQLGQPWHYTRAAVLCNLESDPTGQWHGQDLWLDLQGGSPLALGHPAKSMLGSLTLLTENSWGEQHCYRFEEEEGLMKLLAQLLGGLNRRQGPLAIPVFSGSKRLSTQLEDSLSQLLQRCQELYCRAEPERTQVWPLALGSRHYGLFFDTRGLRWQRLNSGASMLNQLKRQGVMELPRPDLGEDPYSGAPAVLRQYARTGIVQVFVRERSQGMDIYLVDETNQLSYLQSNVSALPALVDEISDLHGHQQVHSSGVFNLPQFYRLETGSAGELEAQPLAL
ncbi:class I adenylate cyclase [Ferrimonas marina]|uniref:Adenylate cyclase, class 1 n=1 Tax=Ferrimonas marina TaxID=299255 RepID=A0A1M5XQX6_9GAMM|nr:class I adenylate cyclase [Ferrimonas marina]SHI01938.1 adenylate cyclase, class 1 [Ferrimonas marina]